MPITFRCPQCGKTLRAPTANAGKRAKCKGCEQVIQIPAPQKERSAGSSDAPKASNPATSATSSSSAAPASPAPPAAKSAGSLPGASAAPQANLRGGGGEPDFAALANQLPEFVAGRDKGATSEPNAPAATGSGAADPFAELPEFQSLSERVEKQSSADAEFHRMMMVDSQPMGFSPTPNVENPTPHEQPPSAATVPAANHEHIADLLGNFETEIQSAVQVQKVRNDSAVRAKFTPAQIKQAFAKPLEGVKRVSGLRRKQLRAAFTVAMVPLGFVAFVISASVVMFLLYRAWMHGDDDPTTVLHPGIGLSFVVAVIVLLCCWVPTINLLFAGWSLVFGKAHQPVAATQLTRESQPVMYEFVDQICEKVGSPKPCRIDLDCEFNASASLRRGWLGSGKNDLVLTIGIPLISIQNTEQLASVIAHEFGHFRQGSAMKTYYVIGSLTQWFIRSAQAGFAYFYVFGYLTHRLSGTLSREMEWDADRHAIHLAGTKAFEESSALLERYGVAYSVALDNLYMLFQAGVLVDNIPRFVLHIGRTMPASVVRRIAEETEKQRLDSLDSHPPTRDRVRAAREMSQPGILSINRPATDLIDHWTPLCKKITLDFYNEALEFEVDETCVTPLEDILKDEHKLLLDKADPR